MSYIKECFIKKGIKAVLFDKDGTLLDFEKTWRPLLDSFLTLSAEKFGLTGAQQADVLERLGVEGKGFTSDSVFVKDNLDGILEAVEGAPTLSSEQTSGLMSVIKSSISQRAGTLIKPHLFDGAIKTLSALKDQGYILGLVSSDRVEIVNDHVKKTGLDKIFDFIAADDGENPIKPHPHILENFCQTWNIAPHQVAMVGDSIIDMRFAKENDMGCAVYVLSGYPSDEAKTLADMVLSGVVDLS